MHRIEIARATDARGELALARRGDVLELVVDGVFAMDSAQTSTEQALARLALDRLAARSGSATVPTPGRRVLVGGLGLGYTARTLLDDPGVGAVEVVELHAALVDWAQHGLLPQLADDDPRLTLTVGDVLDVVPARHGLDAVLLDVDNGPDFLVHTGNADVYASPFLTAAYAALAPGGVLAVWSCDPAPTLRTMLTEVAGDCTEVLLDVPRGSRTFTYALYLAERGPGEDSARP
ncbi:MAG: spermidine synthase [Cellulomonas sp.]|nr:spermidine synthase [Cellulomonas sp.]